MISPASPVSPQSQTLFAQQFLPEITIRSIAHFSRLDPEACEEAVQDCICQAWVGFRSAIARGKRGVCDPAERHPGRRRRRSCHATRATLALFANRRYDTAQRVQAMVLKGLPAANVTDAPLTRRAPKRAFPGRRGCPPKEKTPENQGFSHYARQDSNL